MVVFGVVVVCLAVVGTAVGETIYVDGSASGSNNGSSWTNAYNYLRDALADANSLSVPVEIWVAAGTYTPDVNSAVPGGSGDRNATFQLINGVAIYGGFPVGGGIWEDRDPNFYETVLSGDLAGDDDLVIEPGTGGGIPGENCAEAGPINRGETYFNTMGSTTDGPSDCGTYNDIWYVYTAEYTGHYRVRSMGISEPYSPGLSVYEGATCPPTVLLACGTTRVSFTVTEGTDYLIRVGGQFSYSEGAGTITITRDMLGDNSYHVVTGSGTDANAILDGLTITSGISAGDGGGMYNDDGSPTVANCTFNGNSADRNGGGMYNDNSNPTITNCTFSGNSAVRNDGGGIFGGGTITNCTFSENSARSWGGGIRGGGTVTNCTFIGNSAYSGGGGFCNWYTSPTVINCTFIGNSAYSGGGMQNYLSSPTASPTVTNCTFIGNSANKDGGGMQNNRSSPTVTNCTFIGNSANDGSEGRTTMAAGRTMMTAGQG